MIVSKSVPAGSVPYSKTGLASQARGAEGVGDRRRRVAHQQRALQAQRHVLDHSPRTLLERRRIGELTLQLAHARVQPRVGALRQLHLGQEHLQRPRLLDERAQHVEADHVARALPDRGERRLAVEPRHARLLHIACAAETLERLERMVRRALAHPVLADRRRQALEQLRVAFLRARSSRPPGRPGRHRRWLRRKPAPGASPGPLPPRPRGTDRRARCASAAGRSAACQRPRDGPCGASRPPRPHAYPRRPRSRNRAACAPPSR